MITAEEIDSAYKQLQRDSLEAHGVETDLYVAKFALETAKIVALRKADLCEVSNNDKRSMYFRTKCSSEIERVDYLTKEKMKAEAVLVFDRLEIERLQMQLRLLELNIKDLNTQ